MMNDAIRTRDCVIADLTAECKSLRAQLAALKAQSAEPVSTQLRKIHPLDIPLEVFLADLTTRPANIIRAEMDSFKRYAGTGTYDIEPPFTVRHLMMFSRSEMRRWPNFGKKCLNEVEEMLRARGLQLWEIHDERSLRLLREHNSYFSPQENQTPFCYHDGRNVVGIEFRDDVDVFPLYTTTPTTSAAVAAFKRSVLTVVQPDDSYQDEWFKAKADCYARVEALPADESALREVCLKVAKKARYCGAPENIEAIVNEALVKC